MGVVMGVVRGGQEQSLGGVYLVSSIGVKRRYTPIKWKRPSVRRDFLTGKGGEREREGRREGEGREERGRGEGGEREREERREGEGREERRRKLYVMVHCVEGLVVWSI